MGLPLTALFPTLFILVVFIASLARAQSGGSNVTCTYALWEFNALGQSPCFVWGQLQSLCLTGGITVTALVNSSFQYSPPARSGEINECNCNVVSYNLMAACSWCQPGILPTNWVAENTWEEGCTSYDSSGLSFDPTGIEIPDWAYIPDNGASWDPTAVSIAASAPSSSGVTAPSPGSSGVSATGVSTGAIPTQSDVSGASSTLTGPAESAASVKADSSPTATSSDTGATAAASTSASSDNAVTAKPNVTTIVGAVVGGVGGLALVGGLILYFFRLRARKYAAAQPPYNAVDRPSDPPPSNQNQISFVPKFYDSSAYDTTSTTYDSTRPEDTTDKPSAPPRPDYHRNPTSYASTSPQSAYQTGQSVEQPQMRMQPYSQHPFAQVSYQQVPHGPHTPRYAGLAEGQ